MLAHNFKSADELKISDVEHATLIMVLRMMERGEIVNFPDSFTYKKTGERGNPKYLYMPHFFAGMKSDCGTAACLAGWCHMISDGKAFPELKNEYSRINGKRSPSYLSDIMSMMNRLSYETKVLFKLDSCIYSSNNPPVEEVAIALRAYLTTGNPEVE